MNEIGSVAAILGSLKTAAEIVKLISETDTDLQKAEQRMKLAEVLGALADAKLEAVSVRDLLAAKEAEISDLRAQIETSKLVFWKTPSYYIEGKDEPEGPFCQRCYDADKKFIRLQQPGRAGYWVCRNCESSYTDESYESPKPRSDGRRGSNWVTKFSK
ncbi:MAG: hypothetical protein ABIK96_02025 [bacterium]